MQVSIVCSNVEKKIGTIIPGIGCVGMEQNGYFYVPIPHIDLNTSKERKYAAGSIRKWGFLCCTIVAQSNHTQIRFVDCYHDLGSPAPISQ